MVDSLIYLPSTSSLKTELRFCKMEWKISEQKKQIKALYDDLETRVKFVQMFEGT